MALTIYLGILLIISFLWSILSLKARLKKANRKTGRPASKETVLFVRKKR